MVADGMLTRQRYREVPPRVDYELTERARELAPVLGELARWGHEWAWGPPRPSERVDLGAIFRLIPGLVGPDSGARGTVELTISDGEGDQPKSYMITLSPGSAAISEREQGEADAQIEGSSEAWIQALSPHGALGGLRTAGNRGLVETLLSILALSDGHRAERGSVAASA